MSALLDLIIGFVSALVSAAFLHFGAGGATTPRKEPAPAVAPAQQTAKAQIAPSETADASDPATQEAAHQAARAEAEKARNAERTALADIQKANQDARQNARMSGGPTPPSIRTAPVAPRAPAHPRTGFDLLPVAPPAPPALTIRIAVHEPLEANIEAQMAQQAERIAREAEHAVNKAIVEQDELRIRVQKDVHIAAAAQASPEAADTSGPCPQQMAKAAPSPNIRTFVGG
ncbi:MAG: hypothetical protein QM667_09545 [Asticcacaulis sp.]